MFDIFHAKEITFGHEITTEVTGAWLNVLLVQMTSQRQERTLNNSFLPDRKVLDWSRCSRSHFFRLFTPHLFQIFESRSGSGNF